MGTLEKAKWVMPPLPFFKFIKLLGHKFTEYQEQRFREYLPITPHELFVDKGQKKQEIVFLWGKGSGKDYTMSLYLAWVAYLLTAAPNIRECLGSGYPRNMPIHLVAVATTFAQSQEVLYAYLAPLIEQNKEIFPGWKVTKEFAANVENNIRILALHSKANSWEGLNPFVWVMDEASGYPEGNANQVYDILHSSANTRYGRLYTGVIMSYPRFPSAEVDFTLGLYEKITSGQITSMAADRAPTWVVRGQEREVYAIDYERDPAGASLMLECIPIAAENALFNPQRFRFSGKASLDIENPTSSLLPTGVYSIGIDAGFEKDAFGIAVARKEGSIIRVVGLHRYAPKQINTLEVLTILKNLQGVLSAPVHGDSFNSKLFGLHLNFVEHPITKSFYKNEYLWFRKMLYEGMLILPAEGPYVSEFKQELFSVYWKNNTVKHPPGGSKDLLDAVVMAVVGLRDDSGGVVYSV